MSDFHLSFWSGLEKTSVVSFTCLRRFSGSVQNGESCMNVSTESCMYVYDCDVYVGVG